MERSKCVDYELIDVHVHTTEHLSGYGRRGEFRSFGNGKGRWATGEEEDILTAVTGTGSFPYDRLVETLDSCGVSKAVMMQGSYFGFCNDYVHEAQSRHPGRLFGMGTFDPYCRDANRIMKHLVEDFGFLGFKFEMSGVFGFSGYHPGFKLDGELMRPVFEYASDKKLVVSLDLGTFGEESMQVKELSDIAVRYPGIRFVAEHIFYPHRDHYEDVKAALEALADRQNVSYTVASIPNSVMPDEYPYPLACRYLEIAKSVVGAKRLMWGSDIPGVLASASYRQLIGYIADAGIFGDGELKDIYAGNAKRVYGI